MGPVSYTHLDVYKRQLWVHVADVEARARAANLYLPEGTVRMLPDELTDRLALGLQEISPALSLAFATGDDAPVLLEIVPSWLRVTRTTYEAAEACLDESPYRELLALSLIHILTLSPRRGLSTDYTDSSLESV